MSEVVDNPGPTPSAGAVSEADTASQLPDHLHLVSFDHQPRTRLIFGADTVDRVGELASELGAGKVLLVTDQGIVAAGHADRVHKSLELPGSPSRDLMTRRRIPRRAAWTIAWRWRANLRSI